MHSSSVPGSWRADVVLNPDFSGRFLAVVHDARGRGCHLLSHVTHLRICAEYRDRAGGNANTGSEFFSASHGDEGNPQYSLGGVSSLLSQPFHQDFTTAFSDAGCHYSRNGRWALAISARGRRIFAEVG